MNFLNFRSKILPVITIVLTLLISACSEPGNQKSQQTANASVASTAGNEQPLKDAPDFTLKNRDGELFTLSEHEGKVVVLNFWATWCAPCRKEIPDFMELHEELNDDGVLFAGISLDEEGWGKVRPYANDMGINYPIMLDDGRVSRDYGPIRAIPTTFIINKKGKVEYVAPGMLTKERLKPILKKLASREG